MILHTVIFASFLQGLVMSALECFDWQNKSVPDGMDYYPDKNDPCYLCRCNKGYPTMCKTVSCAPPNCPNWKQIPGECCKFECLDKHGIATGTGNGTGPPKTNGDMSEGPTDHTVTDLGLRLVASTVTTFLILALLLFLIHRFRQRRLLMTLRRYSRRREQLDDLVDSISISPDFFGIQCPPYEDPPPPYTPPKPQPGERPPPYEDINSNTGDTNNVGQRDGNPNCDQNCNHVTGRCTSGTTHENSQAYEHETAVSAMNSTRTTNRNEAIHFNGPNRTQTWSGQRNEIGCTRPHNRNSQALESLSCAQVDSNVTSVHFRNNSSGQSSITMGIHNRNRSNRNRYSDGTFNISPFRNPAVRNSVGTSTAAALNLELRNTVSNYRNRINQHSENTVPKSGDLSSSTTDIGESTTSAESLSSSPESPSFDMESIVAEHSMVERQTAETLADDANSTVKRFLDRQFGGLSKNRRYPTTMSQSWTSAQVSPQDQPIPQSISLSSFQPKVEAKSLQKSSSMVAAASPSIRQNLARSKSEHLKTNGSLINQPYKSAVKSPVRNICHVGHAVRVAYKEADELPASSSVHEWKSGSFSINTNLSSPDTTASVCSGVASNTARLVAAILDPGDIIVTRRQDELRKLRLSHLLNKQTVSLQSQNSLQRSLSENSLNSVGVCSEVADRGNDVALSNDVQYPTNSYRNFMQSCLTRSPVDQPTVFCETNSDVTNKSQCSSASEHLGSQFSHSRQKSATNARPKLSDTPMVHSWHAEAMDSCEENSPIGSKLNTLGRNTNTNIEKKICLDKDVTNIFFPRYKPTNAEIQIDRNSVPSSEMRACASQLYNYETEEKKSKKDKKHTLFKRHSAGCFPLGNEEPRNSSPHRAPKQHRVKASNRPPEKACAQILPLNSAKDGPKKRMLNKERKSGKRSLQAIGDNCTKIPDSTAPILSLSRSPAERPTSLHVMRYDKSDWPMSGTQPIGKSDISKPRSKSLGRNDHTSSSSQKSSHQGPRVRKKKSAQLEQGMNMFQQELEHVLLESKSSIKCPVSGPVGGNRNSCAITQV